MPAQTQKEQPVNIASPVEMPFGSGETILLVEDEPVVLEVSKTMLLHLNYRVLMATNGEEALAVYDERKDEIVLVITDIIMPKMDGPTLLNKLKAQDAAIKVIMMTGYPLGETAPKFLVEGIVAWLYKPISIRHLYK